MGSDSISRKATSGRLAVTFLVVAAVLSTPSLIGTKTRDFAFH